MTFQEFFFFQKHSCLSDKPMLFTIQQFWDHNKYHGLGAGTTAVSKTKPLLS